MKTSARTLLRRLGLPVAVAAGLVMVEGAQPSQAVEAASWQEVWSNLGAYCEGCCQYSFCCNLSQDCRVWVE